MQGSFRRFAPLLATFVMLGLAAPAAHAASFPCDPLRALGDAAALPPAYRAAVTSLVEATSRPGKPWSCSGGTIDVSIDPVGGPVRVTIVDAQGRTASREVESPEDLRAVAEALLAKPVFATPVAVPSLEMDRPDPPSRVLDVPTANPLPLRPPRLLLALELGPRLSGPIASAWVSGDLRGAIPIDLYEIALWVRLSLPVATRDLEPHGLSWQDTSAGFGVARTLLRSRVDLAGRFDVGLSVVTMDSEERHMHDDADGARVGFRIGLGFKASMPLSSVFRGVAVLDGALAPSALLSNVKIAPGLPDVPVYSFGLSLGAEAKIK